jgi:hypothetical protein
LIVKHNSKHRIEELATFLSRERAQTMPEYTFTLSVISGTSVLALTGFSDSAANAMTGLVGWFL